MNRTVQIDGYWEVQFGTTRFDTGAATDADATPTYRVYEEGNDTVIASGDCAKRDDANTAGYYYARAQATTAAGFEVGKRYFVRVAATVNSVEAADVVGDFVVIPSVVHDALVNGTDYLPADAVQVEGGDATDAIRDALVDDATRIDASALNTLSGRAPASTIAAASDIPAASAVADAVWDEASTGHTDAGKAGAQVWTDIDAIAVDVAGLDGAAMRGTDNAALAATALSNATWTDARAGYLDELGAANIPADIDALLTRLSEARAGYLDKLNVSGTLAHSDAASSYMADVSALALEATLTAMKGGGWNTETLKAISDAIGALNDLSAEDVNAEVDTALADYDPPTKAELDSAVSPLATSSNQTTIIGYVDILDDATSGLAALKLLVDDLETRLTATRAGYLDKLNVSGTLAHSDAASSYQADVSALALQADLTTVDGIVDAIKVVTDKLNTMLSESGLNYQYTADALELAPTGGSAPTAEQIADAVWDELSTGHTDAGKAGAQVWIDIDAIAVDVAGLDGAAMRGTDNAALAATALSNATWTDEKAGYVDAAVSSRSSHSVADVATAVWAAGTRTLTGFGSLVSDIASAVWAAVTRTLTSGAAPTVSEIADGVWDELIADHSGAGSTGQSLAAAGGAADPLLNAVPGSYAAGTAGYVIGTNLDAQVSDAVSSGTGAKVVTITVLDDDSDPVRCEVVIANTASGTTNASTGQLVLNLDAGTYSVHLGPAGGYEFSNPYSLVVTTSATQSHTLTCTKVSISDPAGSAECKVYGYVYDQNNEPVENAVVKVRPYNIPALTDADGIGIQTKQKSYLTNSNGYFEVVLLRSSSFDPDVYYEIECDAIGYRKIVEVPDSATSNWYDLKEATV